jgi:hypothetical protein
MKLNEGNVDRVVRIFFGLILLSQIHFGYKTDLGYIGFIPLITGIIGVCPIYKIFGINTCTLKKSIHINKRKNI